MVFTVAFINPSQLAMQWTRILGSTKLVIIMCWEWYSISCWKMSVGNSSFGTQLKIQINRFQWLQYTLAGNTSLVKALNGLTLPTWDGQAPRVSIILFTSIMLTFSMTWVIGALFPTFASLYVVGTKFYRTSLNEVISRKNETIELEKT